MPFQTDCALLHESRNSHRQVSRSTGRAESAFGGQGLVAGAVREPRHAAAMETRALNLEGRTTLKELAHIYRRASIVVTPDSGPLHIAAAVGTPVVALFGASEPARTGPYGRIHTVVRSDLPCSPCFRKTCETRQCMKDITVEAVFAAVRKYTPGEENVSRR